jgi:hypothetical protein
MRAGGKVTVMVTDLDRAIRLLEDWDSDEE